MKYILLALLLSTQASANCFNFGNCLNNQFITDQAPRIYDSNGNYRGRLSGNKFYPESISNEFGRYGSKFSPDSLNNPFGAGSQLQQFQPLYIQPAR